LAEDGASDAPFALRIRLDQGITLPRIKTLFWRSVEATGGTATGP
jgi:hypothetical protein